MSGPAGNWHGGSDRHLRICREEAWGRCPAEPSWQSVPVAEPGYGLKAANPRFTPRTMFDGWRRAVRLSRGQEVSGCLATLLWPQLSGLLLEMALDRVGGAPRSYTVDYYTPADPRRCLGAMVDRLELIRRPNGADVSALLFLHGKVEEPHAALAPADFDYAGLSPVPFTFHAATVSLDSDTLTGVEGFALSVRNNLSAGPSGGGTVSYLAAGVRAVSLELMKLDDSSAVNAAVRAGAAMSFQITLTHPEGHSLHLALPVLYPEQAREEARPADLARTTVRMEAGSDEAGTDIAYAVDLKS